MTSIIRNLVIKTAAMLGLLGIVSAVGCGGPAATLTGVVTIDGAPIDVGEGVNGTVVFEPQAEGGAPATAKIGEGSRYEVATGAGRGLAPGDYLVSVSVVRVIPAKQEGYPPWAEKLIPPKYGSVRTSGLSVTVNPGANEYDIPLESAGVVSR